MSDPELLDDLIRKLDELQEQLSMAQLEVVPASLLASRVQHVKILAHFVLAGLQRMKRSPDLSTSQTDKPESPQQRVAG
jgi:hypothetical protein